MKDNRKNIPDAELENVQGGIAFGNYVWNVAKKALNMKKKEESTAKTADTTREKLKKFRNLFG